MKYILQDLDLQIKESEMSEKKIKFSLEIAEIEVCKNAIKMKMWQGDAENGWNETTQVCSSSYSTIGEADEIVKCLRKMADFVEEKLKKFT